MDGKSKDIKQEQIKKLKQLFPEAMSEGKVDLEMLKATLGEEINTDNERYVLNRAGKAETFRILQQPTTATLAPAVKEFVIKVKSRVLNFMNFLKRSIRTENYQGFYHE